MGFNGLPKPPQAEKGADSSRVQPAGAAAETPLKRWQQIEAQRTQISEDQNHPDRDERIGMFTTGRSEHELWGQQQGLITEFSNNMSKRIEQFLEQRKSRLWSNYAGYASYTRDVAAVLFNDETVQGVPDQVTDEALLRAVEEVEKQNPRKVEN